MDITELLERAVADVVPAERRPTDAVLRLADSRRLGTRLRKALAGLVGLVVIGGGVAVVATGGQDDGDRDTAPPPRPIRLTVDVPDGWTSTDGTLVDCTTALAARTIYRDAEIGNLADCADRRGVAVDGPVLLIGHLTDPVEAEQIRSSGTPVQAGGIPGFAVSYDAEDSYIVWLPAGSSDDLVYAALAPRSEDGVSAYEDPMGFGTGSLPQDLVDLVGTVTAKGDLPTDAVLPDEVSGVDLHVQSANRGDGVGARILDPDSVAQVMATLERPSDGAKGCGETASARILHLQDARTHRWVRVDVLDDGAGCRSISSELGGQRQITGDPVAVATGLAEPQVAAFGPAASTVQAHGLSVGVPQEWKVVRGSSVDPCLLPGPSVVVADELTPSCNAAQYARPTHPFVWVTSADLEHTRLFTDDRSVAPVDGSSPAASVRWTEVTLQVPGTTITGLLGMPDSGSGRLFVVGLDQRASVPLRQSVEPG